MKSGPMKSLSITEIADVLKVLWKEPNCPGVVLVGSPGGGKTSIIGKTVAADLGIPYYELMGNVLEPSDVYGIPHFKGEEMAIAPPSWAKRIAGTHCILNFDELNTARPATLAALLRVMLERKVGDIELGPNVCIVATMNPADEAAHGWELPPAVANRLLHFRVAHTPVSTWKKWALAQDELPEFHTLVAGFNLPSLHEKAASGPFASPRSWYFALKAAARMMREGQSETMIDTVVAAAVGPGNALAWRDAMATVQHENWAAMDVSTASLQLERIIAAAQETTAGATNSDALFTKLGDAAEVHPSVVDTLMRKHMEFLRRLPEGPEFHRMTEILMKFKENSL